MSDQRRNFSFDMAYQQAYKTPEGKLHVVGIASDSAEDRTGDRMSSKAIASMVKQAKENRLSLLDNHRSTFGFGATHDAWTKQVDHNGKKITQFHVDFELDDRYPQAVDLFREVSSGKPTKQLSIGGFLNLNNPKAVRFEDGPKGSRVRVLDDIELEHIATTRPGQAAVPRTKFVDAVIKDCFDESGQPVAEPTPPPAEPSKTSSDENNVRPDETPPVAKVAVPHRSYPVIRGEPWNWNSAASNAVLGDGNWGRYKAAHTWVRAQAGETPEQKGSYKLPHHVVRDGALVTHERGVLAAMGALLGARGGVDIPAADRPAVYNHLAQHYRDLDREPPELRNYSAEEFNQFHEAQGFDMKGTDMTIEAKPAAPAAPDSNKAAEQPAPTPQPAANPVATINAEAVSKGLEVLGRIAKTFDMPAPPVEQAEVTALVKAWDAARTAGLTEKSYEAIKRIRQAMSKLLNEPEAPVAGAAPVVAEKSVTAEQIEQIVTKACAAAVSAVPNNNEAIVKQFGTSFTAMAEEIAKGLTGMGEGFKVLLEKQSATTTAAIEKSNDRLAKLETAAGVRQSAPQQDHQVATGQQPTPAPAAPTASTSINKDAVNQARRPDASNPFRGMFDRVRGDYMQARR